MVNSMFCGKGYMLSRFTVMTFISSSSREQIDIFVRETSRSLALYFSNFYDCTSFGSLGLVFDDGGEFLLCFLIVFGLGDGVENCC